MDTPTTAPTRQEVLQQFRARGISIAQWSRDRGTMAFPIRWCGGCFTLGGGSFMAKVTGLLWLWG